MQTLRGIAALLIAGAFLSGCAAMGQGVDRVASAVRAYCASATPAERSIARGRLNAALAQDGHSVAVTCAGDPQ